MNKALLLLSLIIVFSFTFNACKRYKTGMQSIAILPFEDTQKEDINLIKNSIEKFYGYDVTILQMEANPSDAYNPSDDSYDVKKILVHIFDTKNKTKELSSFSQIIGLINAPIKKLNSNQEVVYPMIAKSNNRIDISVISTYSIKNTSTSVSQNRERLKKIVLHEIGNLLGLGHCHAHQKCLMRNFNEDITILDSSNVKLCNKCSHKIGWN